ncbi:MAG: MCE family protein [Phycisphaeraceae bacterium]|nr:MCE family protein [Phycisphaeraceae bacterium]
MSASTRTMDDLPVARIERPRRGAFIAWAVPIGAIALAVILIAITLAERGEVVEIRFADAHGLKVGDPVRYLGVRIGDVESVRVVPGPPDVLVRCRIREGQDRVLRAGARYWIVRPRFESGGISGLETLVGPNAIAVLAGPAGAPPQRLFVGLPGPPVVAERGAEDLEVIIEAPEAQSLRAGSHVLYRRIRVGVVTDVALAADGGSVEIRVLVHAPYRDLVHAQTDFWVAGGVRADLGLRGLRVEVGPLAELLEDALFLAAAPAGPRNPPAAPGHRFQLQSGPPSGWAEVRPGAVIGADGTVGLSEVSGARAAVMTPTPRRATATWRAGAVIRRGRRAESWVVAAEGMTASGPVTRWFGPADVLDPGEVRELAIAVDGEAADLAALRVHRRGAVAARAPERSSEAPAGAEAPGGLQPQSRVLADGAAPIDIFVVTGPGGALLPVTASRLSADHDGWRADGAIVFDAAWHGAPVIAAEDRAVVGVLVLTGRRPRIGFLPGFP